MIHRILHKIHLWIGIALCVPLVMLGLTGSVLVFQHELSKPQVTLVSGAAHTAGEIIDAARAAAPEGFTPVMFRRGGIDEAASVFLSRSEYKKHDSRSGTKSGARIQMLIDPVSLQVISTNVSGSIIHTVHELHANLMLREYGGRNIVGWFGVAMLIFGISGIVMWWPKPGQWKKAFGIRRGARGFMLWRDLHGAVGLWSWLVFIIVSFSGVYLAFPQIMEDMIAQVASLRDMRASPVEKLMPAEEESSPDVDDVIALAMRSVPDSRFVSVAIPVKPEQPYRVGLLRTGNEEGTPAIAVFVDPWRKKVMEIRDPKTYSAAEMFVAWQHALHGGEGLGWIWRTLVFLMGFTPLLFSFTGISMWLIKRRARI